MFAVVIITLYLNQHLKETRSLSLLGAQNSGWHRVVLNK